MGSFASVFDDSAEILSKYGMDFFFIVLDKFVGVVSVLVYMCDRLVGCVWRDVCLMFVSYDRVDETVRDMVVLGTLFDVLKYFV